MSDEQRNGGSGAVVAIVLVLGILFLLGVIVLVGGALFFVATPVPGNMNIQMPPKMAVAPVPVEMEQPPLADLESGGDKVENADTKSAPTETKE